MNIRLVLGRRWSPKPITAPPPVPRLPEPENEIDVLNSRLDLKQISFVEYLERITQLMQKENQ